MDTAEAVGPGGPASTATAAVSDESPKEPPPRSPEPRDASVVVTEDGKQPTAKKATAVAAAAAVASTALSTPTPPHCLGARGYDRGYFDVGSFFVFHQEPPASGPNEAAADTPRGVDSELLAPPPAGTESSLADSPPSPLGYEFLDGLKVKPSEHRGKAVEGEGSEEAVAAFVELQRQVRPQRLEVLIVVCMPAVFTRPKWAPTPVGVSAKRSKQATSMKRWCDDMSASSVYISACQMSVANAKRVTASVRGSRCS